MVLCPPRCGKPGPNKISVKQRGSASGEGLAAHLLFDAGVHQVGALFQVHFCTVFSVAIQHSCAALVRAIGVGAMAIEPTVTATASATRRTKVQAGRVVGILSRALAYARMRNWAGNTRRWRPFICTPLAVATVAAALALWGATGQSKGGEIVSSLEEPIVGVGMICNILGQAQAYLDLRAGACRPTTR